MTAMFKDGTGGCAGQSASLGCPGCDGLSDVFPFIFI